MYSLESQLLAKFKMIYSKKYGKQLSDKEATEQAESFLNLMKILITPKNITYE